jgi:hypothetical protein
MQPIQVFSERKNPKDNATNATNLGIFWEEIPKDIACLFIDSKK